MEYIAESALGAVLLLGLIMGTLGLFRVIKTAHWFQSLTYTLLWFYIVSEIAMALTIAYKG